MVVLNAQEEGLRASFVVIACTSVLYDACFAVCLRVVYERLRTANECPVPTYEYVCVCGVSCARLFVCGMLREAFFVLVPVNSRSPKWEGGRAPTKHQCETARRRSTER